MKWTFFGLKATVCSWPLLKFREKICFFFRFASCDLNFLSSWAFYLTSSWEKESTVKVKVANINKEWWMVKQPLVLTSIEVDQKDEASCSWSGLLPLFSKGFIALVAFNWYQVEQLGSGAYNPVNSSETRIWTKKDSTCSQRTQNFLPNTISLSDNTSRT